MKHPICHRCGIPAMGEACVLAFFGRGELIYFCGEPS